MSSQMIVRDLQFTRVPTDGQFSRRDQIQAEMIIAYADRPQSQFKYVGIIGEPLKLVTERIQPRRPPEPTTSPPPIIVPVTDPSPGRSSNHQQSNHQQSNHGISQNQSSIAWASQIDEYPTELHPLPPASVPNPPRVMKRRFILILQIIFMFCYAVIVIMQIACLGSPNWSDTSTLGGLAGSSEPALKVGGAVMIFLGIISLLCNVALIALGVWIIFRKVYHKYSIIKRLLPLSVFPWIIGVIAINSVLAYSREFGTTAGFAIAVLVLLIGLTIYADWASSRIIGFATQINP